MKEKLKVAPYPEKFKYFLTLGRVSTVLIILKWPSI